MRIEVDYPTAEKRSEDVGEMRSKILQTGVETYIVDLRKVQVPYEWQARGSATATTPPEQVGAKVRTCAGIAGAKQLRRERLRMARVLHMIHFVRKPLISA